MAALVWMTYLVSGVASVVLACSAFREAGNAIWASIAFGLGVAIGCVVVVHEPQHFVLYAQQKLGPVAGATGAAPHVRATGRIPPKVFHWQMVEVPLLVTTLTTLLSVGLGHWLLPHPRWMVLAPVAGLTTLLTSCQKDLGNRKLLKEHPTASYFLDHGSHYEAF